MGFGRRIFDHFDLSHRPQREYQAQGVTGPGPDGCRPRPGLSTLGHYLCVVLGVTAKFFIEQATGVARLDWTSLVSAAILSAVVFPYVYRKVCDREHPNMMQFFVSFQHGFFIQTVLEQVQRLI